MSRQSSRSSERNRPARFDNANLAEVIRTYETLAGLTVFKTAAFNRSAIPPLVNSFPATVPKNKLTARILRHETLVTKGFLCTMEPCDARLSSIFPQAFKKFSQQKLGILRHNATGHLHTVVQALIVRNMIKAVASSGLGVPAP